MATILVERSSQGERRCDSSCHFARYLPCDCVCRGRYHGRRGRAQELLQKDLEEGLLGEEIAEAAKAAGQWKTTLF